MKPWVRRVRGTIGLGLLWAAGGFCVGGMIELLDNILPGGLAMASAVDMWPQTLAIPGFLGGVIFAVVLMVAARHQQFDELSMPRFAGWGAITGLTLGGLAMSIGAPVIFLAIMAGAATVAAATSLWLARRATQRTPLASSATSTSALPPRL